MTVRRLYILDQSSVLKVRVIAPHLRRAMLYKRLRKSKKINVHYTGVAPFLKFNAKWIHARINVSSAKVCAVTRCLASRCVCVEFLFNFSRSDERYLFFLFGAVTENARERDRNGITY